MQYRLVLWDFDGTLADTLRSALEIYNELAPRHGVAPIEDSEAVRDMTAREFLKAHKIPLFKLPRLTRGFLSAQKERIESIALKPGVAGLLEEFRRAGCQQGVVSSNSEENIRRCLRANGVESHFDVVVGVSRIMGKESALKRALSEQGVAPAEALYIGDETRDIKSARKVGIEIVAVTWGLNSHALLADYRPTYLVDEPAELSALIGQWQPGAA